LTPAKAQSTPSSEGKDELSLGNFHHYFPTFAAFASLREILRFFWLQLCRARLFVVKSLLLSAAALVVGSVALVSSAKKS